MGGDRPAAAFVDALDGPPGGQPPGHVALDEDRQQVTLGGADLGSDDHLRPTTREMLHLGQQADPDLAGKKVLIVDDDLRNIFALTCVLEHHGMQVVHAENGREGIAALQETPAIDIVLINRPDEEATGAGETAITLVAAAIGNAVFDATGARLRQVPFTPDRVKTALRIRNQE